MQQQYGTTLAFHAKITKEYNTHNFPVFHRETEEHNFTHHTKKPQTQTQEFQK